MALPKALEDLGKVVDNAIRNLGRASDEQSRQANAETSDHLRQLAEKLNKAASDVAGN